MLPKGPCAKEEEPGRLLAQTEGRAGQAGGGVEARRAPESPGPTRQDLGGA